MNSATSSHGGSSTSKPSGGVRKNKAPQPTVVWGLCGYWIDPNYTASPPGEAGSAASDANSPGGAITLVSIPASQLLETTASKRYFQSNVTAFQPICVAFHVGACSAGQNCEQLHVQRNFLRKAILVRNPCCAGCGDAFTQQLLHDVPHLNHLALDLLLITNGVSTTTVDAPISRTAPIVPSAQAGVLGSAKVTAPPAVSQTAPPPSAPLHTDSIEEPPAILEFEFDTNLLPEEALAPNGNSSTNNASATTRRITNDSPVSSLAADTLAQLPVLRQIRLSQIAITTALQRGEPGLCVDHLILRGGCARGKDCAKFHLCRKLWQHVHADLSAGGSVQIRVVAESEGASA